MDSWENMTVDMRIYDVDMMPKMEMDNISCNALYMRPVIFKVHTSRFDYQFLNMDF